MANPKFRLLIMVLSASFLLSCRSRSIIEPCSTSESCPALVRYTLSDRYKVVEVASRFQVDPIAMLAANAIDISYADIENYILPSGLVLHIPVTCSCMDGLRHSLVFYTMQPSDTLADIADTVYSGLVSVDQIADANGITSPDNRYTYTNLSIPLPCTCFGLTDNGQPAVYLSHLAKSKTTVSVIAAEYFTTESDIKAANQMSSSEIEAGDILAIPLTACASSFARYATDAGLIVPNGSYAITANHCVQCSCVLGNQLYCTPAPLAVSCSSMQCRNSNLMLGNLTYESTVAGCNVTSCTYNGYVNGTILTMLSASLQPRCPGSPRVPLLIAPPVVVTNTSDSSPPPAAAPLDGGARKPVISPPVIQGVGPAPLGIVSGASYPTRMFLLILIALLLCYIITVL